MSSDHRAALRHPDRHQAKGKVVVGWCRRPEVSGEFFESLYATLLVDHNRPDPRLLGPGAGFIGLASGPRIVDGRTQIVDSFLGNAAIREAEWLWMLDTDMVFEPDTLYRLLDVADPIKRPIIGALCFAGGYSGEMWPTIYRLVKHDGHSGVERVLDYPRDSLMPVGATGAACLLVHRSVLMAMARPHPAGFGTFPDGTPNPHPWFVEGINNGQSFGEDVAFCMRANALKLPIHVHTGVKIGHVKTHVLDEALFDERQAAGREVHVA